MAVTPTVEAQEVASSFDQLRVLLKHGDTVRVTDSSGREITGKVADLSSSSLGLLVAGTRRDVAEDEVTTIRQRRHGNLATGAKWGLGIGAALGVVGGLNTWGGGAGWVLLDSAAYGAIGAGIGVGISAMISHQHVIYTKRAISSLTVSPLLTRERTGMLVSLGF